MGAVMNLALLLLAVAACPASAADARRDGREKVLVDSDAAVFMDDGAALAMMLSARDEIDVLGVSIVIGNFRVADGVEYVFSVLKAANRSDVPVFLGADKPLKNSPERVETFKKEWGGVAWTGAYGRSKVKPPIGGVTGLKARPEPAVDFIIRAVRENPGEVTILALGPLTNIALALEKAPDIAPMVKRIVIMGGNAVFTSAHVDERGVSRGSVVGNSSALAEFNFWFDPEAAKAVLRSTIEVKELFGLDITNRAKINKSHYDEIVRHKTPITALFEVNLGWNDGVALKKAAGKSPERDIWDTIPAAYLLDASIVTDSETMHVDVIDQFGPAYGALYAHRPGWGAPGAGVKEVRVMKNLDFDRFFAVFKTALTAPVAAPER